MKDARTTNHVRTVAITLWAVTGLFLGAAWAISVFVHPDELRWMLAPTAVIGGIAAGTAHSKMYAMKLQLLVRMTAGLIYDEREQAKPSDPTESARRLHSVP